MRTALITGGAGFIGTNTAERLLADGWRVRILDDLSRPGVKRNADWLAAVGGPDLDLHVGDVRDDKLVGTLVRDVDAIFHFAAQVAVTTSLEAPLADAAVNIGGTLALLEAARACPHPPAFLFTSTNKVYGGLAGIGLRETRDGYEPVDSAIAARGIDERRPLQFCTPYGCSKGAADQYVLDWAASYGLPAVVFRMSCIYGPHQFGTEDQGWVAHFLISALAGRPITIYGDGRQVRDILYAGDLVDALLSAAEHAGELAGRAFNIGGGRANAVSLREVLELIGGCCGQAPELQFADWRQSDQRYYVTDHGRFSAATGWRPQVSPREGVAQLHDWLVQNATGSQGPEASVLAA